MGLQLSTARRPSHEKQVAERFNRILQNLIRLRLFSEAKANSKDQTSRLVHKACFKHTAMIVNECVEAYNSIPHGSASMYKSNPFDMDEALSHSRESGLVLWNEDNLPEAVRGLDFTESQYTVCETKRTSCLNSSVVERSTVNRLVVGSSPT